MAGLPLFQMPPQLLRHTVRGLRRRPAFALTAVLSLGVGIGATTTVSSVVNAVLVQPLPYATPGRLVAIWPGQDLAEREVEAIRRRARSYDMVASHSPGWLMALTGVPTPRELDAARVSANFFTLLGVRPLLGQTFGAEAEVPNQDRVAVLSYELWESSFGRDTGVVGRSIMLGHEAYTVAAVMPRGFRALNFRSDLWTPMTRDPTGPWWAGATEMAYGRLRPGTSVRAASADLASLAPEVQREFQLAPEWSHGARVIGLQESMVGALRPTLFVLFAAVTSLLALAVANVATLCLVRAAERRHELAVRASLGATSRQIGAVLFAESLVLGVLAGATGIALAYAGLGLLRRILPPTLPRLEEIAIDGRVLGAAVALTLAVSLLLGLAPLAEARSAEHAERLRADRAVAGQGERARGVIVSLEVALAVILAIGATLMGRTLVALTEVDPGLKTDRLLTMRLEPSADSEDAIRAYWRDVLSRVRSVRGVTSAATLLHLPTSGRAWSTPITVDGRPLAAGAPAPRSYWQVVSPGYFGTAGVPVVRGRDFGESDGPRAPRVIAVNTVFADRIFGSEDPIGRRIRAGNATRDSLATIVAVVGSVRHDSLNVPAEPEVYVALAQRTIYANSLVIRTATEPLALVPAIRAQIVSVDRDVPISEVRTMNDLLAASLGRQRMMLVLLGLFAGIGLLLSTVGIYGVVAYGVRQRVKEMGIRMALGATAGAIHRLVVGDGMRYAAVGVAVGVPTALALGRLMRGIVYGVSPADPASFVAVPVALTLVAAAASWVPARRAAAVGPAAALQSE